MTHPHAVPTGGSTDWSTIPWIALLLILAAGYAWLRMRQPSGKGWDHRRSWCWYSGVVLAGMAVLGPGTDVTSTSFPTHMWGHLLLGMLAPIGLVMGAPITLILRALPQHRARRFAAVMGSPAPRFLTHPISASILHIGGLVALYRTDLYGAMHGSWWIGLLVHVHVLTAGYLFTAAVIGIDPIRHRPGYTMRAVVLVAALGAHAILAKSLYAAPPAGVPLDEAQIGSQVMYYGGDAVDILLIVIFCWQWYRASAPRETRASLQTRTIM